MLGTVGWHALICPEVEPFPAILLDCNWDPRHPWGDALFNKGKYPLKPRDDYHNEPKPASSRRCSLHGLCNKVDRKALLIELLECKENIEDENKRRSRYLELNGMNKSALLVEWAKHDDVQKVRGVEGLRTLLRLDDKRQPSESNNHNEN